MIDNLLSKGAAAGGKNGRNSMSDFTQKHQGIHRRTDFSQEIENVVEIAQMASCWEDTPAHPVCGSTG